MSGGLYQAFIYLAAALLAVPLAKRFGLGSVLGNLLAGVVIGGPFVLGLVDGGGVVMMPLSHRVRMRPALLWRMRRADPRDGQAAGHRHGDRARHRGALDGAGVETHREP